MTNKTSVYNTFNARDSNPLSFISDEARQPLKRTAEPSVAKQRISQRVLYDIYSGLSNLLADSPSIGISATADLPVEVGGAKVCGIIDHKMATMQLIPANAKPRTSPVPVTRTVQTLETPSIGIPATAGSPVEDAFSNSVHGNQDYGLAMRLMTAEPTWV